MDMWYLKILITTFLVYPHFSRAAQPYGYEFDPPPVRVVCESLFFSSSAKGVTALGSHLRVDPTAVNGLLAVINRLRLRFGIAGIQIIGSRTHKLWGSNYDLDVGLLPKISNDPMLNSDVFDSLRNELLTPFADRFQVRIDLSSYIPIPLRERIETNQFISSHQATALRNRLLAHVEEAKQIIDFHPNFGAAGWQERLTVQRARLDHAEETNLLFQFDNIPYQDLRSAMLFGMKAEAAKMGFGGKYISDESVIAVYRSDVDERDLARLHSLGYRWLYWINDNGTLDLYEPR